MLGIFEKNGIEFVHHYAPLHYLPFIARSRQLMCKPSLENLGFNSHHLRSKSHKQDVQRGFGAYTFLTLDDRAGILRAKLLAGFPHIGIRVPAFCIEQTDYLLCRYNVAMTRGLRRDESAGFPESASNGRYYDAQQIPVAKTVPDKQALLKKHYPKTMIEVLINGDLQLPDQTAIVCFSESDLRIAQTALQQVKSSWKTVLEFPPGPYNRSITYAGEVTDFITQAFNDASWRGNGLEFDRV